MTIVAIGKLGYQKYKPRNKWTTQTIMEQMSEKRKCRGTNQVEYKRIHKVIKSVILEAKSEWLKRQCQKTERFQQHFLPKAQKIKRGRRSV